MSHPFEAVCMFGASVARMPGFAGAIFAGIAASILGMTAVAQGAVQVAAPAGAPSTQTRNAVDVAAIYFPSWHEDDHYSSWYGEGWNEWKLIDSNPERFPGHNRIKPAKDWGYYDEADPAVMARQIDLAVDHGISVFIFDWYWYSGVQILQRPVEETLPKTANKNKMKYALMWANHTWVNYYPYPYDPAKNNWLLPIRHSAKDFDRVMQHCIEHHFNQPNYWKVKNADGKEGVYYSIFSPEEFMKQLGGAEATRKVLDAARQKVRDAGLGEIHFAAFTGIPQSIPDVKTAGFDSMTSYNITTMTSGLDITKSPLEEYDRFTKRNPSFWSAMDTGVLPYGPVATVGWDATPRWERDVPWPPERSHYPYSPTIINNTPEKFGDLVRQALKHMDQSKLKAPALFINSWNEWTEGGPLMPQVKYGDGYLRELKKALDEHAAGAK